MRRILTAITAIALAFSLVAQTTSAEAAVPGYDSQYVIESAFLTLDQGETGQFTVTFENTGTTTWVKGTSTEVVLAACLEDKVTCNAQDADEAEFNEGWVSATIYATAAQTSVPPGGFATYTYSVTVPDDAEAGTYRFNGALVLRATGADIHNEGYYQDVTVEEDVAGEAPELDELDPDSGSTEGGDEVTITGTGFQCTPEFPTVMFGDNEAEVLSCGAEQLTVETPAADTQVGESEVDVTVANAGGDASDPLTFTYEDDVRPTFDSVEAAGQTVTMTFSEPVCIVDTDPAVFVPGTDIEVLINGVEETTFTVEDVECDDDEDDRAAQETITLTVANEAGGGTDINEGDTVTVRLTTAGSDEVEDTSENDAVAATRTTTADEDATAPAVESVEVTDANTLTITFSEGVECDGTDPGQFVFNTDDEDVADATATAYACDGTEEVTVDFAAATFGEGETGVLEYTEDDDPLEDLSGNDVGDFEEEVTPSEADPPLIDDAELTATAGFSGTADSGDEFTLTFSEDMAAIVVGDTIRVEDEDGTIVDIVCEATTLEANIDADIDDNDFDVSATCELDGDTLTVRLHEDSSDADEAVSDGDTPGLEWPATIVDTSGITDEEGNDPDLAESEDIVIDDE